jgi:flagella basal body P-ring formation protein FlgA
LTLASFIAGAAASAAAMQLSLKTEALVSGARVTLADVAMPEDGDRAGKPVSNAAKKNSMMWTALAAIDLGSAPRPGYTDRYSRKEIERLVRQRGIGDGIVWSGAQAVRIERIAQVFDAQKISDSAEAYLRELLRGDSSRIELQLAAPIPDPALPSGRLELKPRPMQLAQALRSRVTVWVDVVIDGAFVRSITVPFKVQAYRPVLIAKRDLSKVSAPQCDAFQLREEDVAAMDSPPFPADCKLLQGNLKRALTLGAPLLKASLQAPVAVTQGESVSLQLISGALMLESRAVAIGDGEVGQRIFVKPSASTETILAEVIAPGVVKVNGK